MPKVRVTPIVGLPQFDGWSQIVESPPHSSVKIVLSIAIEGNHAGNVGRDIANFFSSQVIQTFEEFHSLLEEIIDQAAENDVHTLFSAGYFSGEKCAYATFNGAVLLKRESKIGTILSSGHQLKLITGKIDMQDVVVFSTLSAARFFTEIQLKFEQGYDADTIVASVVPGLHAEKNSSLSALAFVSFEEGKPHPLFDRAMSDSQEQISSWQERDEELRQVQSDADVTRDRSVAEDTEESEEVLSSETTREESKNGESLPAVDQSVAAELRSSLDEPVATTVSAFSFAVLLDLATKTMSAFGTLLGVLLAKFRRLVPPLLTFFSGMFQSGRQFVIQRRWSGATGFIKTAPSALKSLLPSKDVYIETSSSSKVKKARLLILVVTVVICLAAVVLLFVSKRNAERAAAEASVRPFIEQIQAAEQQSQDQPLEARNVASAALREIEDLQAQYSEGSISYQVISAAREEAELVYTSISGLDALQELPVFYDLRLVSSDFIASQVLLDDDVLYFVDTEQKTIISLVASSKKAAKASIQTDNQIEDVTIFEGRPLILSTSGVGSITDFSQENEEVTYQEEIAEGDSNRNARFLTSYETYLYVLNPEKRNIFRYAANDDTFSDPIGWMQEVSRGLDFEDVASITVDGDVWLGMKDGRILKFTRGKSEDFSIRGMQQQFDSSVTVRSLTDGKYLFVLEPARNRLVVLQKNGDFIKEISNASLGAVTDIIPAADESSVYAISGSVVYRLEL